MPGRRRRAAGNRSGEDGFSLVEMLVVLAILGLVAASAGPALDILVPARGLERGAETLRSEIDLLRGEALRTGRITRLTLDGPANRFLSSRPAAHPIALTAALRVDVPSGKPATPGEIRFRPDGSSSGGRIVLASGRASHVLVVSPLTGLVHRGEGAP